MISLSIESLARMSQQDADALRAIADIYSPKQRNDSIPVGRLRELIGNGNTCALSTLAELNGAAPAPAAKVEQRKHATIYFYRAAGADERAPSFDPGDAYYNWNSATVDHTPAGWSSMPPKLEVGQILYCTTVALSEPADTIASPLRLGTWHVAAASLKVGNLSSMGSAGPLTATGTISGPASWSLDANGKVEALGAAFLASAQSTAARTGATAKVHELHPHDNPAMGAPTADDIADQVFSGGAQLQGATVTTTDQGADVDPAQVFSGGAALPGGVRIVKDLNFREVSIVSDEPDGKSVFAIGATATLEQPAPNVQSGTPIPPPLPIVTAANLAAAIRRRDERLAATTPTACTRAGRCVGRCGYHQPCPD
jgi:hypothetical protein